MGFKNSFSNRSATCRSGKLIQSWQRFEETNEVRAGLSRAGLENKIKRMESGTTNTTGNDCERLKGAKYVCLLSLCQWTQALIV